MASWQLRYALRRPLHRNLRHRKRMRKERRARLRVGNRLRTLDTAGKSPTMPRKRVEHPTTTRRIRKIETATRSLIWDGLVCWDWSAFSVLFEGPESWSNRSATRQHGTSEPLNR